MITPLAYELKRIIAQSHQRFWCAEALKSLPPAPVYLFPDQVAFDSDELDRIARWISAGPLCLPHPALLFEVTDQSSKLATQVVFVQQRETGPEAFLFLLYRAPRRWTDVLCYARFRDDGFAEIDPNPSLQSGEDANLYASVLTGIVWRALAILSQPTMTTEHSFSRIRRPKLARAGVSGWIWHLAEIDLSRIRSISQRLGGTHASPRWHIRRGHWRTLPDGRRTFVRECEVGDPTRGGVVKDYRLVGENAA